VAPLVSVWCWYQVGSRDESAGLTGASHWVEHMNFKGTQGISQEEFKDVIDRFGGFWNGYTWIDQTTYVSTATRDALDQMLTLEAEWMDRCLYAPEAFEAERTVIISELQGGENDPDQLLDIQVTATAFKAHPYRHPTIGWIADLQAMSRDDLYGHYRRHYRPNNATLVIVGDVEVEEMAQDGVTESELVSAKQYLAGEMPRSLETNAGIARFLQTIQQFGLELDYDLRLPELVDAVTLDEVAAAARAALATDRAAIAIAGPCEDAP